MTRRLAALPLLTLLLLAPRLGAETLPTARTPESLGLSAMRLERIREVMQRYTDQGRIAGTVTYVARAGRIAHLEAVGMADIEAGKAMKTDTVFRIASQTKALTSVAVMMLVATRKFRTRLG